ncbi:unnamed protein product [Pneumocystis jirovecii]|uniref:Cytochrome b5 heme-binding domain-containing protein n=2 Tax=Pneumocystis jirovecii TaxID=42068 RepID=L0PHH5_PNEJI|nr:uncharacterized protein T551_03055 [Pneumocystis jirovecii RU7]KTW27556.1 hypothetical protein T551_03055 [Pneumocystis jirovecii RU7]CCJ31110.1 unnamed protein product [Pneumocystis jirovecii]
MEVKNIDIDSLQKIDVSEVAKHASRNDLYMVIHKMVYDISRFISEHPGGEEVLLDLAGQDATDAFEDVGHSDEARDILKNFLVGKLEGVIEQPGFTVNSHTFESKNSFSSKIYLGAVIVALLALAIYVSVSKAFI